MGESTRLQAKRDSACRRGYHDWRAINGGPFGHTQPDEDGYLQVCANCKVRRPATPSELYAAEAIRGLLEQLHAVQGDQP